MLRNCARIARPRGRRGITLMEVLISMFIMLIGLLGVGALIPVGRLEVGQGDRLDRAASIGRAAFREVKVRDMLALDLADGISLTYPNWWYVNGVTGALSGANSFYASNPTAVAAPSPLASFNTYVQSDNGRPLSFYFMPVGTTPYLYAAPLAFAIDPWGLAANAASQSTGTFDISTFPYNALTSPSTAMSPYGPYMQRVGLRSSATLDKTVGPMQLTQANAVFQSRSDLTFLTPTPGATGSVPNGPAVQQFFPSTGPPYSLRQSDGDYSWLITVAPNNADVYNVYTPPSTNVPAPLWWATATTCSAPYTVSVVVYYKRVVSQAANVAPQGSGVTMPSERLVSVSALNGLGVGGGEVTLSTTVGAPYLNVKRGQWIMLSSQILNWSASYSTYIPQSVFRWYRVVSADDVATSTVSGTTIYTRNVTLAGPDWPVALISAASTGTPAAGATYATICDGVVAVFEKTISLERSNPWTNQ